MKSALRAVVGVVAALFVALVLVIAVELVSAVVHPLPADFDGSMEQMCRHVENYPAWVLAVAVPAWGAIALVAAWLARRIGGLVSAAIVGLLLTAAVVCNVSMLPYPIWFTIAALIAIPASSLFGGRLATARAGKEQASAGHQPVA
jgi:hypothetical protein